MARGNRRESIARDNADRTAFVALFGDLLERAIKQLQSVNPMKDQDIIQAAYADALKQLFATLLSALVSAKDDAGRDQAEQRFQTGLKTARQARDRAIALVQ